MAEWTSDRSYRKRIRNLSGDQTRPGFTERANGNVFLRVGGSDATVKDDEDRDILTGASGLDWFFVNLKDDLLTGGKKGK